MTPENPFRVVVCGGGFAAAETVLALRAHAGDRIAIDLVAPEPRFAYRPASTAAAFTDTPVQTFALADLALDAGARLIADRLEAVAPEAPSIRL